MNTLVTLPQELLSIIVSFLNISSRFSLRHTSPFLKNHVLNFHNDFSTKITILDDAIEYPAIFKWLIPDATCFSKLYAKRYCLNAVTMGSFEIIKYMPNDSWFYVNPIIICTEAVNQNRLDILQWLYDKYSTFITNNNPSKIDPSKVDEMSKVNELSEFDELSGSDELDELSDELFEHINPEYDFRLHHHYARPLYGTYACTEAARNGYLDILQWLMSQRCSYDCWTLLAATKNGHLEIVKYLCDNGCCWNYVTLPHAIGHFEILKYLHERGCPLDSWTFANAAAIGNLETLQWLRNNGCPSDTHAYEFAARNGHLDVLKWLKIGTGTEEEVGTSWSEAACIGAVQNGHIEILKWLHDNGFPWDKTCCHYAAENGDLEILKYLRQNGCYWNETTFACAAQNGHLETVKWLHENGCPLDEWACIAAYRRGHTEVLKYLQDL